MSSLHLINCPPSHNAQVRFSPGTTLGVDQRATLAVASPTAGCVSYALTGQGMLPGGGRGEEEGTEVAAVLDRPASCVSGCGGWWMQWRCLA
jgi:hypothetical protein